MHIGGMEVIPNYHSISPVPFPHLPPNLVSQKGSAILLTFFTSSFCIDRKNNMLLLIKIIFVRPWSLFLGI